MLRRNAAVLTLVPAIDRDTGDDRPTIDVVARLPAGSGLHSLPTSDWPTGAAVVTSHAHEIHAALPGWKVIEV